ncbi:MAG TPA: choice-of-anchor P family protein [Gemmatimonadales bacterium]|nr:choice-of-anchor P family protein [Gemmatimonadales bacterium]
MIAILSLSALLAIPRGPLAGQSVGAQAVAASVRTLAGSQSFAAVSLPQSGGMENVDADNASVANTLGAGGLTSITSGQVDDALVSATASAEAADVNILNGLIAAKSVVAFASSYANGTAASSESNGSTVISLVVGGVSYADGAPAPNTRVDLPGVGYVILNEQISSGDGVHSTGLTVNMIHVYLVDSVTGAANGEIVVGAATSSATR